MGDMDECEWFNDADGPFCWNGFVVEFDFFQNNLRGTSPEELQLDKQQLNGNDPACDWASDKIVQY
jgi:hypothetical protein